MLKTKICKKCEASYVEDKEFSNGNCGVYSKLLLQGGKTQWKTPKHKKM